MNDYGRLNYFNPVFLAFSLSKLAFRRTTLTKKMIIGGRISLHMVFLFLVRFHKMSVYHLSNCKSARHFSYSPQTSHKGLNYVNPKHYSDLHENIGMVHNPVLDLEYILTISWL